MNSYNITQVYISKSTNTGPDNYLEYDSDIENTLFWGMYNLEEINLCCNHNGRKYIYWHYNDCNPNYKLRKNKIEKIIKLKNVYHLCNDNSAIFLDYYHIKYDIILYSFHDKCPQFENCLLSSFRDNIIKECNEIFKMNNSNKKLIYKLKIVENITIKVIQKNNVVHNFTYYNNKFSYKSNKLNIFDVQNLNNIVLFIFYNFKTKLYEAYNKKIKICDIKDINDIVLYGNKIYEISINYPLCIDDTDIETKINLMYLLDNLYDDIGQINILHTTKFFENNHLDNEIINKDVNYICIYNNFNNFNLGFTRNLYKYLNLSKKIMMSDIDIIIAKDNVISMKDQLNNCDIVTPYINKIYYSTLYEKYNFLKSKKMSFNILKDYPKTICGGIVLFNEVSLLEFGGYDEVDNYGYEDRNLDVLVLNSKKKVIYNEFNVIHLYHSSNKNKISKKLIEITKFFYNCYYQSNLSTNDNIHTLCNHNYKYLDLLTRQKVNLNGKLYKINFPKEEIILTEFNGKPNILKSTNLYNNNIVLINGSEINDYYIINSNKSTISFNDKVTLKNIISNKYLQLDKSLNKKIYKFILLKNKTIKLKNGKIIKVEYLAELYEIEKKIQNKFFDGNFFFKNLVSNKKVIFLNDINYNKSITDSFDLIISINFDLLKDINNKEKCIFYCKPDEYNYLNLNEYCYTRLLYPIINPYEYTTFQNVGTLKDYLQINHNKSLSNIDKNEYIILESVYNNLSFEQIIINDMLKCNIKEIYINKPVDLNDNKIKYL